MIAKKPRGTLSAKTLRGLYGALCFVVLIVLFETVFDEWSAPVPQFTLQPGSNAIIGKVVANSATATAGVQEGDQILQINQVPFDLSSLATFNEKFSAGDLVQLTLGRDGQIVNVTIPLVAASQEQLSLFISGSVIQFLWWALSFILLWRFIQRFDVRMLYLLVQTAVFSFSFLAMRFTIWYRVPDWQQVLSGTATSLSVPLAYHFVLATPGMVGRFRFRTRLLITLYIMGAIAAVFWIYPILGLGALFGKYLSAGLIALTYLVAVVSMILLYFNLNLPGHRIQMRLMISATVLLVGIPVMLCSLPDTLTGNPVLPAWVTGFCVVICFLVCGYSILRKNLNRADLLFNRAIVYLVLLGGIFLLLVGPVVYLDRIVPQRWFIRASVIAGLTLFVALSFYYLRRWVQQWVDRIFYGSWYDYPQVVDTIGSALASSLERSQLEDILTRQIPELMQLSGAQLSLGGEEIHPDEGLLQPQLRIPLEFEGKAYGTWIIGPRRDGDIFSSTDQRIFTTLTPQVEVALSNILLVEELHRQLDEIRNSQEAITRMGHQILRSRDEEQARLSRELHDGPLQELVGINLQLGLLLSKLGTERMESPMTGVLSGVRDEVRSLMVNLREVCAELRPPMLDTLGLSSALHALVENWFADNSIPVDFELSADSSLNFLTGEVSLNLYRVVQEALNNISKHAHASQVKIILAGDATKETMNLTIQDNGIGFEMDDVCGMTGSNHFGLVGMQERAASIGGDWEIISSPGRGTTIRVTWEKKNWQVNLQNRSSGLLSAAQS